MSDIDVLFRWSDSAFGLTGWGYVVLFGIIGLWSAGRS